MPFDFSRNLGLRHYPFSQFQLTEKHYTPLREEKQIKKGMKNKIFQALRIKKGIVVIISTTHFYNLCSGNELFRKSGKRSSFRCCEQIGNFYCRTQGKPACITERISLQFSNYLSELCCK